MTKFNELGLAPVILKSLAALGFDDPTPIQQQAIPLVLAGKDVMGLAQTGTGKTAAFGLPIIHHLLSMEGRPKSKEIRALVVAPTRELVTQIGANLRNFLRHSHLRITTVVGGTSINVQQKNLGRGNDILIATPGRLLDLVDRRAVFLNTARFLVLDEADQMLDLGFIHDLRKIANLVGQPRQTLLFSATMPKQIDDLAQTFLDNPVQVATARSGRTIEKVNQSVHFIHQRAKTELLKDCLIERRDDLSLVFARTKHGAEKLMKHLVDCGFSAASIHGNKSQGQRTRAINAFRSGDIRVLVATDVAARGIDIPGVTHVYNYDLPEVAEAYVHRIGRTARAGAGGEAVAFCAPEELGKLGEIEKLMQMSVRTVGEEFSDEEIASAPKKKGRGRKVHRKGGGQKTNANKGKRRRPTNTAGAARADGQNPHHQDGNKQRSNKPGRAARKKQAANTNHPNNNRKRRTKRVAA